MPLKCFSRSSNTTIDHDSYKVNTKTEIQNGIELSYNSSNRNFPLNKKEIKNKENQVKEDAYKKHKENIKKFLSLCEQIIDNNVFFLSAEDKKYLIDKLRDNNEPGKPKDNSELEKQDISNLENHLKSISIKQEYLISIQEYSKYPGSKIKEDEFKKLADAANSFSTNLDEIINKLTDESKTYPPLLKNVIITELEKENPSFTGKTTLLKNIANKIVSDSPNYLEEIRLKLSPIEKLRNFLFS